jgi:hypothetical protein
MFFTLAALAVSALFVSAVPAPLNKRAAITDVQILNYALVRLFLFLSTSSPSLSLFRFCFCPFFSRTTTTYRPSSTLRTHSTRAHSPSSTRPRSPRPASPPGHAAASPRSASTRPSTSPSSPKPSGPLPPLRATIRASLFFFPPGTHSVIESDDFFFFGMKVPVHGRDVVCGALVGPRGCWHFGLPRRSRLHL